MRGLQLRAHPVSSCASTSVGDRRGRDICRDRRLGGMLRQLSGPGHYICQAPQESYIEYDVEDQNQCECHALMLPSRAWVKPIRALESAENRPLVEMRGSVIEQWCACLSGCWRNCQPAASFGTSWTICEGVNVAGYTVFSRPLASIP